MRSQTSGNVFLNETQAEAAKPRLMTAELSDRIIVARVICILAVIYVHMPPYMMPPPDDPFSVEAVVWMVREGIGRTSVPLLSVVSGFLTVQLLGSRSWESQVAKRCWTLLLPLAAWNLIAIGKDLVLDGSGTLPDEEQVLQALFGIVGYPRITPLYFLRDMFLCALLCPIALLALRKTMLAFLAFLLINSVLNFDGVLFTNSAIPLFFVLGLAFGSGFLRFDGIDRYRSVLLPLSLLSLGTIASLPFWGSPAWIVAPENADPMRALQVAERFAGAVMFWLLARGLLAFPRFTNLLKAWEKIIFVVFCSHTFVVGAGWMVLERTGQTIGSGMHLAYFLTGPLLALAAAFAVAFILSFVQPRVLQFLAGGRAPTQGEFRAMVPGGR